LHRSRSTVQDLNNTLCLFLCARDTGRSVI
jgi:hypothetical protein